MWRQSFLFDAGLFVACSTNARPSCQSELLGRSMQRLQLLIHDEECPQSVEIVGAAWPSVIVSQVTNIRSLADISDVRVPVRIERNLSEHA